ncbi:MAG: hypothetical protein SOU13_07465, partial [Eubacteriales bacterium]|nr:hypothetical protein [Eubacteriales bacterium]
LGHGLRLLSNVCLATSFYQMTLTLSLVLGTVFNPPVLEFAQLIVPYLALVDKVVIQQDGHMEFCFRNGMLGIRNMREQCFLTAAIQNIKRMVSSFFLALFCLSLQQNPAFADWRGLSMV